MRRVQQGNCSTLDVDNSVHGGCDIRSTILVDLAVLVIDMLAKGGIQQDWQHPAVYNRCHWHACHMAGAVLMALPAYCWVFNKVT